MEVLEKGKVIEAENGNFMIITDEEGYESLLDLRKGKFIDGSWDENKFKEIIGKVYKQYTFK